ncbi:hypothetical protein EYF80_007668 [Liparis tanakae]|uniref:Uncharacterized protein n=1 Tax=Liparis tanakae TaxID=230148 RepID=A0A4Z2IXK6_9TELE|nr:hypothetical protein EYF80_007668 [Liparis tanakae]
MPFPQQPSLPPTYREAEIASVLLVYCTIPPETQDLHSGDLHGVVSMSGTGQKLSPSTEGGTALCQQSSEIYSKPTQPVATLICPCAAENTNHLADPTQPSTIHFIFCANEFIIRRDLPLGASAVSREGAMA